MNAMERQLWEELVRAEDRINRLCSQVRDQLVGTDVAVVVREGDARPERLEDQLKLV